MERLNVYSSDLQGSKKRSVVYRMQRHEREIIGVDDRVSVSRAIPLGIQHMMSMFGSTVLVPVLTGLDPNVAIMCSGIGTICYLLVTRNKIPSYLGSSFAFISPIVIIGATRGLNAALSGVVVAGLVFLAVAGIIKLVGTGWLDRLLPPVLVASVMVVIGVGLSATAAKMAFQTTAADGTTVFYGLGAIIAAITLFAAVIFSSMGGLIGTVPVLLAIILGYLVSLACGLVDFQPVIDAAWIGLPAFQHPEWDWGAIALIGPVALVVVIEHIGHLLAVGEIVGKDYRPMLPRSLAGDGISTVISGFLGGPPTTTYAENIGVMAVTGVYSVQVIAGAAVISILMAFIGPLSAFIATIPGDVIGGITFLLYGMIGTSGLRILVDNHVDYSKNRNMILTSVIFVTGLSGVTLALGDVSLSGMTLAAIVGMIMSLVFYAFDKLHLSNDA